MHTTIKMLEEYRLSMYCKTKGHNIRLGMIKDSDNNVVLYNVSTILKDIGLDVKHFENWITENEEMIKTIDKIAYDYSIIDSFSNDDYEYSENEDTCVNTGADISTDTDIETVSDIDSETGNESGSETGGESGSATGTATTELTDVPKTSFDYTFNILTENSCTIRKLKCKYYPKYFVNILILQEYLRTINTTFMYEVVQCAVHHGAIFDRFFCKKHAVSVYNHFNTINYLKSIQ